MRHRTRPDSDDDLAALAAVWGREASATAAPQERPQIAPPPGAGRPRRLALVAGAGLAAAAAIVATVVVVGGDDDRATESDATDAEPTTAPAWEPGWTTPVTCPRLEVTPELRTTACPVATDEQRTYVIESLDDETVFLDEPVPTLVATGVASGRTEWAVPFPDGASQVLRYPSMVLVVGPGGTHGVDPGSGEVRWTLPGMPLASLGPDHVLLDRLTPTGNGGMDTAMSVIDAASGAATISVSGPSQEVFAHPCGAAGLVLVSEGERLRAHDVVDGAERWSVDAPHHGGFDPLVCSTDLAFGVEEGVLVARDLRSGAEVVSFNPMPTRDAGFASILAVAGRTVVVSSDGRLEGYSADADLRPMWQLDLAAGGRDAIVGPAGGGVAVVVPGDRAAWFDGEGAIGPEVSLAGDEEAVLDADRVVSWGGSELFVAAAANVDRARRLELDDVRRAAATSTHVVVTTRDEVRLYPFDP